MADESEINANEGADPTDEIKKQNPGQTAADAISADDPHKVEKLAKVGKPNRDPDSGSD